MEMAVQQNNAAMMMSYKAYQTERGRFYLHGVAHNLVQFGRVLTETKEKLPHGEFLPWVKESFGFSKTSAENYMNVWRRFGNSEQFENVQFSNLRAMLALPEGAEESFAQTHDVANMTTKEIQKAVEDENGKIQAAVEAAVAKERAEHQAKIDSLTAKVNTLSAARSNADSVVTAAQTDAAEARDALTELQGKYNELAAQLRSYESVSARGETVSHAVGCFNVEDFEDSCQMFLGQNMNMPYMGTDYAKLTSAERNVLLRCLDMLEGWAKDVRRAAEGVILYE